MKFRKSRYEIINRNGMKQILYSDTGKNPKWWVSYYVHSSFSYISSQGGAPNISYLTQPN